MWNAGTNLIRFIILHCRCNGWARMSLVTCTAVLDAANSALVSWVELSTCDMNVPLSQSVDAVCPSSHDKSTNSEQEISRILARHLHGKWFVLTLYPGEVRIDQGHWSTFKVVWGNGDEVCHAWRLEVAIVSGSRHPKRSANCFVESCRFGRCELGIRMLIQLLRFRKSQCFSADRKPQISLFGADI